MNQSSIRGYTLIEMLTTIALLIVVLGLMVSLAREVRYRSAEELTKDELRRLEGVARSYRDRTGHLPRVPPILPADEMVGDETKVRVAARANNAALVEAVKGEIARRGLLEQQDRARDLQQHPDNAADETKSFDQGFGDLPISLYDGRVLADAWGNPIVLMLQQHPAIGMAPAAGPDDPDAFFFFSPGPDGRYLTREDNLYSYEQVRR